MLLSFFVSFKLISFKVHIWENGCFPALQKLTHVWKPAFFSCPYSIYLFLLLAVVTVGASCLELGQLLSSLDIWRVCIFHKCIYIKVICILWHQILSYTKPIFCNFPYYFTLMVLEFTLIFLMIFHSRSHFQSIRLLDFLLFQCCNSNGIPTI